MSIQTQLGSNAAACKERGQGTMCAGKDWLKRATATVDQEALVEEARKARETSERPLVPAQTPRVSDRIYTAGDEDRGDVQAEAA